MALWIGSTLGFGCRFLVAAIVLVLSSPLYAESMNHSPRLSDIIEYQIGGAYLGEPPTKVHTVSVLDMGVGWDFNMECGKFDPKVTVSNQLNGITQGFRDMMDNIIQSATGAVASLPALAIQRANPGLYDLLQQGILQGKMDFEWAETSCEDMSKIIKGEKSFPFENYKLSIQATNWTKEINNSGGDAVKAKDKLDSTNHGDAGVEWVCSTNKGGTAQQPIKALSDVVTVGYNILFDRMNSCDTSSVGVATGQGTPLWEYWNGPVVASDWATRVVGDVEMRTCDGCKKMRGTPGKGLTYMHREMADVLASDLEDLVDGTTPRTWQHLNRVSAPPGVIINDAIVSEIAKRSVSIQSEMIRKLAGEISYARLIEQGRLLTQILRTGSKEPNVAAFEPAQAVVDKAIDQLQVELSQLDQEIETRKAIAQNTIIHILGRAEKGIQGIRSPNTSKSAGTTGLGQP